MSAYPGDPGYPPPPVAGDPDVARVLHALRNLHVCTYAGAIRALDAMDGAGLRSAQITAVLAAFPGPRVPPPRLTEPETARWRSEPIPGRGAGGSV